MILKALGDGSAEVFVEDDGIGWQGSGKPKGTGLGSKIVRAMAQNLGPSVEYVAAERGTRARLLLEAARAAH